MSRSSSTLNNATWMRSARSGNSFRANRPAVGPRHQAVVHGLRIAQRAPLRDLDRVDVTDEVTDRGVRSGQLLGVAVVTVSPADRQVVTQSRARAPGSGRRPARTARRGSRSRVTSGIHSSRSVDQRPHQPGLALAALAEQDQVVTGQQGGLEFGQDRVVEADDAGKGIAARTEPVDEVGADLLGDAARLVSGVPELTSGGRRGMVRRIHGLTLRPPPNEPVGTKPGERRQRSAGSVWTNEGADTPARSELMGRSRLRVREEDRVWRRAACASGEHCEDGGVQLPVRPALPVTTSRLVLREFREDDLEPLLAFHGDADSRCATSRTLRGTGRPWPRCWRDKMQPHRPASTADDRLELAATLQGRHADRRSAAGPAFGGARDARGRLHLLAAPTVGAVTPPRPYGPCSTSPSGRWAPGASSPGSTRGTRRRWPCWTGSACDGRPTSSRTNGSRANWATRSTYAVLAREWPTVATRRMSPHRTTRSAGRVDGAFGWRKKWARDWDTGRYCSDACRRRGVNAVDRQLERAITELLAERRSGATICPSDAARQVSPDAWRDLMEPARRAARRTGGRGHGRDHPGRPGCRPVDRLRADPHPARSADS